MPRTMPITTRVVAVTRRSRNGPSIWSLSVRPSTPIGIEPTITSQPILASCSDRSDAVYSERNQVETIFAMSLRK